MWPSLRLFMQNLQMVNNIMIKSVTSKINQVGEQT